MSGHGFTAVKTPGHYPAEECRLILSLVREMNRAGTWSDMVLIGDTITVVRAKAASMRHEQELFAETCAATSRNDERPPGNGVQSFAAFQRGEDGS